jgi:hypothetical protein
MVWGRARGGVGLGQLRRRLWHHVVSDGVTGEQWRRVIWARLKMFEVSGVTMSVKGKGPAHNQQI